ncbi:uncharacterized protein B0H18DRAFT_950850 [Fomitopsis serialis]|uniref:uncharacterized protein n=1 Tax=Fomitopsis serialis TaxID=139415 RepID=UPI0020084F3B|nr:uncharacterized protein B0H18DRAFT_950850 [Neoantrodia serialis]KAH9936639.1 hypothetical protein B0H18DRAFT_950850 [Neoantrodia serialis]
MSPLAISDYESSDAGSRSPSPGFAPLHSSPSTPYFSDAGYSSPGDIPEESDYASGSEGIVGEQEEDDETDLDAASRASDTSDQAPHLDGSAFEPAPFVVSDAPAVSLVTRPAAPGTGVEGGGTQVDARPVTPPKNPSNVSRLADGSKSTPVAHKPSTAHSNSLHPTRGTEYMPKIRRENAFEMERKIVQVSLETFMQTFVPGADLPSDTVVEDFDPVQFKGTEEPMYDELCKVANSVFDHVPIKAGVPRLVAKNTSVWPDPTDKGDYEENTKPDVTVYPEHDDAKRAYTIEASALRGKSDNRKQHCREKEARTSWLWASLCIEAKVHTTDSPFEVPAAKKSGRAGKTGARTGATPDEAGSGRSGRAKVSTPSATVSGTVQAASSASTPGPAAPGASSTAAPSFLRLDNKGAKQTMGQMCQQVSKILRRQFLSCLFTVFTCRDHAWLLYWDRAGLVVSEPFNFVQQPRLFHNFFYRFACMTDMQRGFDPTVTRATEEDVELMRSHKKFDTDWHEAQFKGSLAPGWPIYEVSVPEEDMISEDELKTGEKVRRDNGGKPKRKFLVGKPYFMSSSPTGGGTRGYIAYDVAEHRLVFFKECWRVDEPTYHPEGDVYLRLHKNNVQFIATPIAAGDVCDAPGEARSTRTQDFLEDSPPKLIQYRIFLEQIGKPLKEYRTSRELAAAMYCCLTAHEQAWENAQVLHRDISSENLLILCVIRDGKIVGWIGILVDWGLCKYKEELLKRSVLKTRSGTWQFISAVLLAFPGHFAHAVWHDLESFIHVLHWMCLRFHVTNFSRNTKMLHKHVSAVYDASFPSPDGTSVGGEEKLMMMRAGTVPFELVGGSADRSTPGLHCLLTELAELYKSHYKWLKPRLPASHPYVASSVAPSVVSEELDPGLDLIPIPDKRLTTSRLQPEVQEIPANSVLEDHKEMKMVFEDVLRPQGGPWTYDDKTGDNFAYFNTSMDLQSRLSRESVKRSADNSVDDRPDKRIRSDTSSVPVSSTSLLGSIAENVEG